MINLNFDFDLLCLKQCWSCKICPDLGQNQNIHTNTSINVQLIVQLTTTKKICHKRLLIHQKHELYRVLICHCYVTACICCPQVAKENCHCKFYNLLTQKCTINILGLHDMNKINISGQTIQLMPIVIPSVILSLLLLRQSC